MRNCIDDADALRAGGVGRVLGCVVKLPSTLETFPRSFRWGHVRQLGRGSRELLARAWVTDAGPGERPLTIDLDFTVCETCGLARRVRGTTTTPASGVITRFSPWPPEP